jgi:predicted subunit of tRNA(5-methylaminomethyl-2-thiouridylate) methyltransferase
MTELAKAIKRKESIEINKEVELSDSVDVTFNVNDVIDFISEVSIDNEVLQEIHDSLIEEMYDRKMIHYIPDYSIVYIDKTININTIDDEAKLDSILKIFNDYNPMQIDEMIADYKLKTKK